MKIDVKELTLQIKLALQDVFDANVSQDERTIKMLFDKLKKIFEMKKRKMRGFL